MYAREPAPLPPAGRTGYSRAFEQIVRAPDDIIGLLAYALYKKVIHGRMKEGMAVPPSDQRKLTDEEIDLYTSRANGYLKLFSAEIVEVETPNILQNAMLAEFRRSTGFWWPGVAIGVVSWLLSIVITILVAYSAPGWVQGLVEHLSAHTK